MAQRPYQTAHNGKAGWRFNGCAAGDAGPSRAIVERVAVKAPGANLDLMDGRVDLPRVGAVVKGPSLSLPYVVADATAREVEPVSS
jgi:hypothetical protein